MYAGEYSELEICKAIGYSDIVFKRILDQAGVPKRTSLAISHPCKLYSFNEAFFDNPESWTEKQAYWMGWMYSDGFNSGKQFGIRLQVQDLHILEELKSIIGYTGPISIKKRKPESILGGPVKQYQDRAVLCISSPAVCRKLQALGIVRNKASTIGFPEYLKSDLYPHFLRGMYDGDGTFCFTCHNKFETNLLANVPMLTKVQAIYTEMGMYGYIQEKGYGNGVKIHRLCGNEKGIRLFNYLYQDANIYLKRKIVPFVKLRNHKITTTLVHKSKKPDCDKFYQLIKRFE